MSPLQKLFEYWNVVRAGRLAPRRLEIEPASLAPILADTFMLERGDGDTYPFRLAGTRLCEIFGAELRGADFLDGWSAADKATLVLNLNTVCSQAAVLRLASTAASDVHHTIDMETILLPLVHAGDTIGRLIGATAVPSDPHWLGFERLKRKKLLNCEVVWPDGRPHSVIARAASKQPFVRDIGPVHVVRNEGRTFRVLQGGRTDTDPPKR